VKRLLVAELQFRCNFRCLFALIVLLATSVPAEEAVAQSFADALESLATADSYPEKQAIAEAISATSDPRALIVLSALLEGQLYTTRSDQSLVIAEAVDRDYQIRDLLTNEDLGRVGRRDVSRVGVNNSLRSVLRRLLATYGLEDNDPQQRRRAVIEIGQSEDLSMIATLQATQDSESNAAVLRAIETAIATLKLDSDDTEERLASIAVVSGIVDSHIRTKLTRLSTNENTDPATRRASLDALERIENKVARFELVKTVFFGLSLGSILALAAIGLSVTFGIMGVINMAHGELIMLGAYTTYVVQQIFPNAIDYSLFIALPLAFCISGLIGIAIERGIVRFLYARPLETLLATFGVSLLLQQSVRSIFSPLNRAVSIPSWMSGSWEIVPGLEITLNRLFIFWLAMFVFAILLFVLRRSRFGLEMRAVTQNRQMAKAMGIRTDRVDALTFGLGAGIAGVAGVALSQLTNVGPNLGQAYIVDSFMVVVFGGVGNIWGTLVGGMTLGVANKLVEPAVGAVMAKIFVLIFLIIFIQKRPRGLFPQKGRAAES
jgi:urea transport system permease protein